MSKESVLVSIIIPVLPDEKSLEQLLLQLRQFPAPHEIIVVSPAPQSHYQLSPEISETIKWVESPKGRARQLNSGAKVALGTYLWFLHVDSKVETAAFRELLAAFDAQPRALYFFRLSFGSNRLALTSLNAVGANLRSRWLKMPFGDQGLCLNRNLFFELKGFDETAAYGEDHLLVWAARRYRLSIVEIPAVIETSPRKYDRRGWLKTTANHVVLTYKQAAPEMVKLIRDRLSKT